MTLTKVSGEAIKDLDFGSENIATTGKIGVGAGSAGAPSINFTSDTNTGIYSPGADQVAISTNGSQRLAISSTGQISIPHTVTALATTIAINNTDSTSGTGNRLAFQSNGTNTATFDWDYTGGVFNTTIGSYGNLIFKTSGASPTERLRITSDGKLGLGTSSPAEKLHLSGTSSWVRLDATATGGGNFMLGSSEIGGSRAFSIYDVSGSAYRLSINSSGNVGIGTTSPAEELHVAGDIIATGDITAFYSSDRRLKKDIEPISDAVDKVKQINGVSYSWNDEYLKDKELDGYFVREREVGVIAQEIEEVLPELVATRENGYKAVKYDRLVALLIEAVKEQQQQIDELKAKLEG